MALHQALLIIGFGAVNRSGDTLGGDGNLSLLRFPDGHVGFVHWRNQGYGAGIGNGSRAQEVMLDDQGRIIYSIVFMRPYFDVTASFSILIPDCGEAIYVKTWSVSRPLLQDLRRTPTVTLRIQVFTGRATLKMVVLTLSRLRMTPS